MLVLTKLPPYDYDIGDYDTVSIDGIVFPVHEASIGGIGPITGTVVFREELYYHCMDKMDKLYNTDGLQHTMQQGLLI